MVEDIISKAAHKQGVTDQFKATYQMKIEAEVLNKFSDEDKKLFNDMINASDERSACTSVENFKIGFVISVRMMIDCFMAYERLCSLICEEDSIMIFHL